MTWGEIEEIAEVLKQMREHAIGSGRQHTPTDLAIRTTSAMATALQALHPNFDRHRFITACLPESADRSDEFGFPGEYPTA